MAQQCDNERLDNRDCGVERCAKMSMEGSNHRGEREIYDLKKGRSDGRIERKELVESWWKERGGLMEGGMGVIIRCKQTL